MNDLMMYCVPKCLNRNGLRKRRFYRIDAKMGRKRSEALNECLWTLVVWRAPNVSEHDLEGYQSDEVWGIV